MKCLGIPAQTADPASWPRVSRRWWYKRFLMAINQWNINIPNRESWYIKLWTPVAFAFVSTFKAPRDCQAEQLFRKVGVEWRLPFSNWITQCIVHSPLRLTVLWKVPKQNISLILWYTTLLSVITPCIAVTSECYNFVGDAVAETSRHCCFF